MFEGDNTIGSLPYANKIDIGVASWGSLRPNLMIFIYSITFDSSPFHAMHVDILPLTSFPTNFTP